MSWFTFTWQNFLFSFLALAFEGFRLFAWVLDLRGNCSVRPV
jgi:hypothetical protein